MSAPAPDRERRALLVLTRDDAAVPLASAAELLERARGRARSDVRLRASDVQAVLRAALALDEPGPDGDARARATPWLAPGRGAALESTAASASSGWRLSCLGALDPTHGLGGDEGIGPPSASDTDGGGSRA